jgi:signal transduction histidine kinase
LSRRRHGTEFSGVVAAAIQPTEFTDFYKAIAENQSTYFAMLRSDGAFLARYPALASEGGRLDDRSKMLQAIATGSEMGLMSVISQVDGIERRLGYRKLSGFPIYLLAGIERSAIISAWKSTMAAHLIFGIPATAIMFVVIYIALKRTQRLYAEATRREAAEAALRHAQKIEGLGQLTGGVAHDFNNLLMIIMGNLRTLERDLQGEGGITARISRALERSSYAATRAASLTQRLLAFSRQQPLAPKILNVNRLLKDVGSLLRRTVGEAHELEIVEAAGVWNIEADEAQLDSAILNLVLNARDATPAGGKITIEASNAFLSESYTDKHLDLRPGQYVAIAVSDKGTGMPPEIIQKAFDPFYTTKPPGQGTGLGLSQVHGFVKQSGGHVAIYSEMGQGTTVKMYFPRSHGLATTEQDALTTVVLKKGNGERILVVEDDDDVRSFVKESLQDMNYNVAVARVGDEALQLVKTSDKFDLLITDVVMPGMNGRQLATEMEKLGLTKVLYMTGYSQNAVIHHGRLDAGVSLLQKPFSREDLAARVAALL